MTNRFQFPTEGNRKQRLTGSYFRYVLATLSLHLFNHQPHHLGQVETLLDQAEIANDHSGLAPRFREGELG
jgi:uncharacterized damage-inducible protein DinB